MNGYLHYKVLCKLQLCDLIGNLQREIQPAIHRNGAAK